MIDLFFGFLAIGLFVLVAVFYVINVFYLVKMDFRVEWLKAILRVGGIFFPLFGAVMGFVRNDNTATK